MNFLPESGYDTALSVLRQIDIPTRDKNQPQPANNSQSVSFPSQQPNTRAPYGQSSSQSMFRISSDEPTTLAVRPSRQAVQPLMPSIQSLDPTGSLSRVSPVQSNHHPNLLQLRHPGKNLYGRYLEISSSSIQGSPHQSHDSSTPIPLPSLQIESRAINTSHGRLERPMEQQSEQLYRGSLHIANFASQPSNSSFGDIPRNDTIMGPPAERVRPYTSPMWNPPHNSLPNTLSDIHPPKRTLPFPVTEPKSAVTEPIEDNADRNLPSSKPKDVPADKSTKRAKGMAGAQKSTAKKPASKAASKLAKVASSPAPVRTAKATKLPTSSTPKPSTMPLRATKANKILTRDNRKASPIVEENLGVSSDQPLSPSMPGFPKKKRSAGVKAKAADSTAITEPFEKGVEDFLRKHGARPAAVAAVQAPISDLEEYVKLPGSERLEVLDDVIMKYIEDDNFTTLCEDVEKSWKRIGLNA